MYIYIYRYIYISIYPKRHRMVQTSMFFQETKASLLKFIWFHFKTTTKKMLVLFLSKDKTAQTVWNVRI